MNCWTSSRDLDQNCESCFTVKAATYMSRDNVKRIFAQLYSRATPSEIRWIARIIIKGEAIPHGSFVASINVPQISSSLSKRLLSFPSSTPMRWLYSTRVLTSNGWHTSYGTLLIVSKNR